MAYGHKKVKEKKIQNRKIKTRLTIKFHSLITFFFFLYICLTVLIKTIFQINDSDGKRLMTPCSVSSRRLTLRDRRIRPRRAHAMSRWGWAGGTRRCAHRPRPLQDGGCQRLPGSSSDRSDPVDMTCLRGKHISTSFARALQRFLWKRRLME